MAPRTRSQPISPGGHVSLDTVSAPRRKKKTATATATSSKPAGVDKATTKPSKRLGRKKSTGSSSADKMDIEADESVNNNNNNNNKCEQNNISSASDPMDCEPPTQEGSDIIGHYSPAAPAEAAPMDFQLDSEVTSQNISSVVPSPFTSTSPSTSTSLDVPAIPIDPRLLNEDLSAHSHVSPPASPTAQWGREPSLSPGAQLEAELWYHIENPGHEDFTSTFYEAPPPQYSQDMDSTTAPIAPPPQLTQDMDCTPNVETPPPQPQDVQPTLSPIVPAPQFSHVQPTVDPMAPAPQLSHVQSAPALMAPAPQLSHVQPTVDPMAPASQHIQNVVDPNTIHPVFEVAYPPRPNNFGHARIATEVRRVVIPTHPHLFPIEHEGTPESADISMEDIVIPEPTEFELTFPTFRPIQHPGVLRVAADHFSCFYTYPSPGSVRRGEQMVTNWVLTHETPPHTPLHTPHSVPSSPSHSQFSDGEYHIASLADSPFSTTHTSGHGGLEEPSIGTNSPFSTTHTSGHGGLEEPLIGTDSPFSTTHTSGHGGFEEPIRETMELPRFSQDVAQPCVADSPISPLPSNPEISSVEESVNPTPQISYPSPGDSQTHPSISSAIVTLGNSQASIRDRFSAALTIPRMARSTVELFQRAFRPVQPALAQQTLAASELIFFPPVSTPPVSVSEDSQRTASGYSLSATSPAQVTSTATQTSGFAVSSIATQTQSRLAYTSSATQTSPASAAASTATQTSLIPAYTSMATQIPPTFGNASPFATPERPPRSPATLMSPEMFQTPPTSMAPRTSNAIEAASTAPQTPPNSIGPLIPRIGQPSTRFPCHRHRTLVLDCHGCTPIVAARLERARARRVLAETRPTPGINTREQQLTGSPVASRKRARDQTNEDDDDATSHTRPQKRRATGLSNDKTRTTSVIGRHPVVLHNPVLRPSLVVRRHPISSRNQPMPRRHLTSNGLYRRGMPYAETRRRVAAESQGRVSSSTTFQLPRLIAQNEADRMAAAEVQNSAAPVSQQQMQGQVERETSTGARGAAAVLATPPRWRFRNLVSRWFGEDSHHQDDDDVQVYPTRQQGDGAARPRSPPVDAGARLETVTPLDQQERILPKSPDLTYALLPKPIDKSSYLRAAEEEVVNADAGQSCQTPGEVKSKSLKKRKRRSSLKEIPNPPGTSYGMDLDYFGLYSSESEEDEEMEEDEEPTGKPPLKRVRFDDDDAPGPHGSSEVSVEAEPRSTAPPSPSTVARGKQSVASEVAPEPQPSLSEPLLPSPPATGPTTPPASTPTSPDILPIIWDEDMEIDDEFSRDAAWMYQQTPSGDLGQLQFPSEDRYADTIGADTVVQRLVGEVWNEQRARAGFVHFCRDFERFRGAEED